MVLTIGTIAPQGVSYKSAYTRDSEEAHQTQEKVRVEWILIIAENNHGNFALPSILKFDGHYNIWAMLMENLLRSKEYWSIMEGGSSHTIEDTHDWIEKECRGEQIEKSQGEKLFFPIDW